MERKNERRSCFFIANRFQRKILSLVFFSTAIPMVITIICLYYLTFGVIANEMVFPEVISYSLIPAAKKVALMVSGGFLISVFFIWLWALRVSHRLAGPLERFCRDLDTRISGRVKGYIYFRKGDYLAALAGRINSLLDKLK